MSIVKTFESSVPMQDRGMTIKKPWGGVILSINDEEKSYFKEWINEIYGSFPLKLHLQQFKKRDYETKDGFKFFGCVVSPNFTSNEVHIKYDYHRDLLNYNDYDRLDIMIGYIPYRSTELLKNTLNIFDNVKFEILYDRSAIAIVIDSLKSKIIEELEKRCSQEFSAKTLNEAIGNCVDVGRKVNDSIWTVTDGVSKLFEEGGELSAAIQTKLGKLDKPYESGDEFDECADVLMCAVDVISRANRDLSKDEIIEGIIKSLNKKTKKWNKIVDWKK